MSPAVSVIVAAYNYGRYLAGALDSVRAQTFADFECLVIDDGSTDDTPAVVAPYLADPRFRYHRTDHLGQPQAKNAGIRLARAPLVAFLDADDLWLPAKLERQVALFRADPDLGVAYCRRRLIDAQGRELAFEQPPLFRGRVLPAIFHRNFVCFSSCLVRRAVFADVGAFDEGLPLAIDYDLWLRVARRYRFDYADEPLVLYRVGHGSLSRRTLERLRLVRFIMGRFLDRHGPAAVGRAVVRRALAENCWETAVALEGTSRLRSAGWCLRALLWRPGYAEAWRRLLSCWWPAGAVRLARRALGRPDWRVRLPAAVGGP